MIEKRLRNTIQQLPLIFCIEKYVQLISQILIQIVNKKFYQWYLHYWISINPKNKDDKCFQYGATIALNYEKISGIQKEFQILNRL